MHYCSLCTVVLRTVHPARLKHKHLCVGWVTFRMSQNRYKDSQWEKHSRNQSNLHHSRIQIESASIHCMLSVSLLSALSVGGWHPPCSRHSRSLDPLISPPHLQPKTPMSSMSLKILISVRFMIVSRCGPCLSPCFKWHHWTKKRGSVSGDGVLS